MSTGAVKPIRRQDGRSWGDLTADEIPDKGQVQAGIAVNQPTAADIKASYESNADTNAFTDAHLTKLNGIETGATADQTGSEIKSLYEGEADTNAFTDVEKSKLGGVEAGADVTDSVNVDAAGAVMNTDSDTTPMGFVIDEDTMVSNLDTKVPTQQSVKSYVDSQITLEKSYQGGYDAATNTPDLDTTPIAGIKKGDVYDVTAAGTFFTEAVEIGDTIRAKQDDPTTLAHWVIVQANLNAASIKTQYESNVDTNAFTDAEKTKLGNITDTGSGAIITSTERTNYDAAYTHSQSAHAPVDALVFADANYYVATTGNDTTGDGSSGTPWATIQKALDYLQDFRIDPATGCTINVAAGTYSPSTTISVDHPDAQYLSIEGAGEASTFIESTATPCIRIEKHCKLKSLLSMKFQQTTYGGTQYVIYLDKYARIGTIGNVDVDKMYSPLYMSDCSQAVVNSCDWSAYDRAATVLFGAFLQLESGTFNGSGGAASPVGIWVYEGKCNIFAACTISNNNVGMQAERDGTILDKGATMTTNTTDYSPARSTAGSVTYGSTFGKILGT